MAFVRVLKDLMRDKEIGKRFVPIAPDEYRTFGMDAFFPSAKIYNPLGQQYESVDRELLLAYKESPTGQMLHDGITEAGCTASLIAAGSAYATHGEPLIPVYVFYSMFGFQRTGDQFWQMADQLARGFVLGATAGRTTLTGEGLQHADGHSQLLASTNPACVAYDPAYGYEIAHIVKDGLRRMYGENAEDVFYYLTVYNEPIQHPAEPADVDVEGILKGLHRIKAGEKGEHAAQILASGVAVPWAVEAQQILADEWNIKADVWSATSWNELRREAVEIEEHNLLHPEEEQRVPYVTQKLQDAEGPKVAVSDWMRSVPDQIARWVPGTYQSLGADGFGFADTRGAARRFFHIDAQSIVLGVLTELAKEGKVDRSLLKQAIDRYQLLDVVGRRRRARPAATPDLSAAVRRTASAAPPDQRSPPVGGRGAVRWGRRARGAAGGRPAQRSHTLNARTWYGRPGHPAAAARVGVELGGLGAFRALVGGDRPARAVGERGGAGVPRAAGHSSRCRCRTARRCAARRRSRPSARGRAVPRRSRPRRPRYGRRRPRGRRGCRGRAGRRGPR